MDKLLTLSAFLLAIVGASSAFVPLNPRIIGGTKAATGIAPFIVSIQREGIHNCGGSILNRNWVVTAGHCVFEEKAVKQMMLVAGTNDVNSKAGSVQKRQIDYYKIHPKYEGGVHPYDIALIYTAKPFVWTQTVKPIKLPKQGYKATGYGTLYGWGSISPDTYPVYPKELRQASNMPILSFNECRKALSNFGAGAAKFLDITNLCTGPLNKGIQACSADSGGPLVLIGKETTLIGVVSWGPTPCGPSPSVFVEVADFINWIQEEQLNRNSQQHHASMHLV